MEKLLSEFIEALRGVSAVVQGLAELGEEKRRAIVLGEVEQLNKVMQKEGIMVSNLEKREGARFKLQAQLASRWGVPVEQATASLIAGKVKQDYAELYDELQAELDKANAAMQRLKKINAENNGLLNMSLDFIAEMQSLLTGDVAGTYTRQGTQIDEASTRPRLRMLDKKA